MVMEIIISVFLLFVGIAILVIIHICIVGRAFRRGFGTDGVPIIRGAGMTLQDLKKLPCFEYKQDEKETSTTATATATAIATTASAATATNPTIIDCAVCLDTFKVGDNCRMLPNCHHYFHVNCVDVWLIKTPFCPICRAYTKPSTKVIASRKGEAGSNSGPIVADELV